MFFMLDRIYKTMFGLISRKKLLCICMYLFKFDVNVIFLIVESVAKRKRLQDFVIE